jgi:arylsulfatase A-like enzyme/Flp pilus assembly protein TadD
LKTRFLPRVLLAVFIFSCFSWAAKNPAPKTNVLLVTIDTIRPDRFSCYSQKYLQTPQIQKLADRGMVFDRAFAHNPTTLPSHVNILVGTTPLYHGVHDNSKFALADRFTSLAEHLKREGYSTGAFIGAFPLDSRFGLAQGFDVYDDAYPSKAKSAFSFAERKAEEVVQAALAWLGKRESGWFCWIHLWDPHAPYSPPEPFKSKYRNNPYSGEVAYVDHSLGKLFDYLDSSELSDNTLVVLTGDHGESLGEHGEMTHGYFAYNSTLWIPLIIAGPGVEAGRSDDYVCHVDIFPTICEFLRIEKPSFLQGVSLYPLNDGQSLKDRPIYFESFHAFYNRGWAPIRGFIEKKHKFMDSPLAELYRLEEDFDERQNIVATVDLKYHEEKLNKLEKKLASPLKAESRMNIDRESQRKLRSLGYIVSSSPPPRKEFGAEFDLKTLLPFQIKLNKALMLYNDNQIEESVEALKELIEQRKDFSSAYTLLAEVYKSQGKFKESIAVLEQGFQNVPESYEILSTYGIYLIEGGNFNKGINVLQKAVSILDFDPEVWNYLGVAYWKKGDDQEALAYYNKALSLDSTDALLFNNLGSLYLSRYIKEKNPEDHSQAIMHFRKAIHFDPRLPAAYNGLGGAYNIVGKIDEAISLWEKSVDLNPAYGFSLYNLGMAYFKKSNKAKALDYLNRYLELERESLSIEEREKIIALIQKCRQR